MRRSLLLFALVTPLAAQTPLHFVTGVGDEALGFTVAGVGDLDGDGCAEIAVGAPGWNILTTHVGRVLVLSGRDGTIVHELAGPHVASFFGRTVVGLGDVDQDGVPDLAVGAPGEEVAGVVRGSVRVFSGADGELLRRLVGTPKSTFGDALACAGDVDADGTPDLVVGASHDKGGGSGPGAVRVYSGATGGLLREHFAAGAGQLGRNVAGGADLDGDGHDDYLAGELNRVQAWSGATGALLYTLDGSGKCGYGMGSYGHSIALVGDQDGDAVADVLVGATCDYTFGNNLGAAYLYSGADGSLRASFAGPWTNSNFGESVDRAGDVDGDGVEDLLVGSWSERYLTSEPGAAWILTSAGAVLEVLREPRSASAFGHIVTSIGDVNGDGREDLAVGAANYDLGAQESDYGAAYVYLLGAETLGDEFCIPATENSLRARGRLLAVGSDVVADDDLELIATQLPPHSFALALLSRETDFVPGAGGSQGNLCLGGTIGRFRPGTTSAAGLLRVRVDLGTLPIANGVAATAGQTWFFQAWYADGAASNLTQALSITLK